MTDLQFGSTSSRPRVVVNPNSFARFDSTLSVAGFRDTDQQVLPGDVVWAVQPDDDGYEGLAPADVVDIDFEHRLIYLRVEWANFETRHDDRRSQVTTSTAKLGMGFHVGESEAARETHTGSGRGWLIEPVPA